jgi:hypothetical protein
MQLELDFTNKGWRRWAIDRCTRLRSLVVVEGGRPIRLNASEAKVLLYQIAQYDDCYASVGRLSDETGITKRNIERLLKAMRESGLLSIKARPSDRGHFPTNHYVVFYSELAYIAEPAEPKPSFFCAQPSATPSAIPSAIVADNKENKRIRNTSSSATEKPRDLHGTTCQPVSTETDQVGEVFFNLGIGTATTLVAAAIARGCAPRSLIAIARWYVRSQCNWPARWKKPTSVLKIRLEAATPNLPAHRGWIEGDRPKTRRPVRPKQDPKLARAELERNRRQYVQSGESVGETYRRLRSGS